MKKNLQFQIGYLCIIQFLSGCVSIPTPEQRSDNNSYLAINSQWKKLSIASEHFLLTGFVPENQAPSKVLTVYIEGDGLAWINQSIISPDPTPINPMALKLALQHPKDNAVAYLARPCQYIIKQNDRCSNKYWTSHRFSSEVIHSMNSAIDKLKKEYNSDKLQLIGYSGGGAIAVLAASQRTDVISLVTLAGNLDHHAWTAHHKVSPLTGSLNPAAVWKKVQTIPQVHFVGANDKIVPKNVIASYTRHFANGSSMLKVVPGFDHSCCWTERWSELLGTVKISLKN